MKAKSLNECLLDTLYLLPAELVAHIPGTPEMVRRIYVKAILDFIALQASGHGKQAAQDVVGWIAEVEGRE